MANILLLDGNPKRDSFCGALADAYAEAATGTGHALRRLAVSELPVDLTPPDYSHEGPPAPWIAAVQADLAWSHHLVLVAPMWWGGAPGALKAVFDQVLTPGFAFRYRRGSSLWDALLKGRSARVIITMDTPPWFFRLAYGGAYARQLKGQVLGFCGFRPVRFTLMGVVRRSGADQRQGWLEAARRLGAAGR